MTKPATILQRFAENFGAPFLMGQKCTIGDFLGEEGHRGVSHGYTVTRTLTDALERQMVESAKFTYAQPTRFDHDAGTFLYAIHELFAACHPQASSFYARSHSYCDVAVDKLRALPRTLDTSILLSRHLIVRRLFTIERTDVHVSWWTGKESFYGDQPPERLLKWRGLRRVNVDRRTKPMWVLCRTEGTEETRISRMTLLRFILDMSPLTRLSLLGSAVQRELGFSLVLPYKVRGRRASPMYLLDDPDIARSVVDDVLENGVESAGAMIALSVLTGLREGCPPLALRRAAELATHVFLTMCIIEANGPRAPQSEALRKLLSSTDDDEPAFNNASVTYFALVKAVLDLGDAGVIPVPPASSMPPKAREYLMALRDVLKGKPFKDIAEPLTRELARKIAQSKA